MLFGWFRCGLVQGFHAVNPPRSAWAVGQEGNAADRQRPCDQRGMTACGTIVSSQRRKGLKFQRKRKTGKTKKTKKETRRRGGGRYDLTFGFFYLRMDLMDLRWVSDGSPGTLRGIRTGEVLRLVGTAGLALVFGLHFGRRRSDNADLPGWIVFFYIYIYSICVFQAFSMA